MRGLSTAMKILFRTLLIKQRYFYLFLFSEAQSPESDDSGGLHDSFRDMGPAFAKGLAAAQSKGYATCPVCKKQLSNQYNLRVHLETHQNVQYSCNVCSHVSRSRDALRKHVSYRHPIEGKEVGKKSKVEGGKRPRPEDGGVEVVEHQETVSPSTHALAQLSVVSP